MSNITIVGRGFTADQFAAYVESLPLGAWRPKFVVLHHAASPDKKQWERHGGKHYMKVLERIYESKGWNGGPHLFVDEDMIWVFNPLTKRGTHAKSWNAMSIGIETVGNYEVEQVSAETEAMLVAAYTALCKKFGIDPATLRQHKDEPLSKTACPGKNLSARRDEIIAATKARLAGASLDTEQDKDKDTPGGVVTVIPPGTSVRSMVGGKDVSASARLASNRVWVAVRPVAEALGFTVKEVRNIVASGEHEVVLVKGTDTLELPLVIENEVGMVAAADFESKRVNVIWNNATKTIKFFPR